jgi:hypothetical protein
MNTPIKPDRQDLEWVEREYGCPRTQRQEAEHYLLAQSRKLVRLDGHSSADENVNG